LVQQLDKEVIACKQRVDALQMQLDNGAAGTAPHPILAELVQVFVGQQVTVTHVGPVTHVLVSLDLLFPAETLDLREEGQFALDLLATALRQHQDLRVEVQVHTDDQPPPTSLRKLYPTNWERSAVQAARVARELSEGYGVSPHRLAAAGRADLEPVATNDTLEGRAQNRRVLLRLVPMVRK
jgi:chemotaxis protein MotB